MLIKLLLLIGIFLAIPEVMAQSACPGGTFKCSTESQAAEYCFSWASQYNSANPNMNATCELNNTATTHRNTKTKKSDGSFVGSNTWTWYTSCPGTTQPDPTPGAGYACKDPNERCLALNHDIGAQGPVPRTWTSKCLASGCNAVLDSPTTTTISGTATKIYRGTLRYTGACGVPPSLPADLNGTNDDNKDDRQECVPSSAGQTMCIKPSGEHCYTASTGRQICWRQGETGDKADGNVLQHRNPGPTEQVPPNPPGETYTKDGDSVTTITNTTTTTTTNYTTVNGTEPPGTDQSGEPSNGSGGKPEGDKDGTTASGGGTCDQPPIVTGDNAEAMIATQAWATRCAVEAGNAVQVTGDIGDCTSAFEVNGEASNANVQKLRAMRAQICGIGANPDGHDSLDVVNGPDDGESLRASLFEEQTAGEDGLNTAGYGLARTCPTPPSFEFHGITYTLSTVFMCDWLAAAGYFVLLIASIFSLRILAGVGES